MSRFAFGLRYFLFGLGSALNTGEHVTWSIDRTQDCPNLCRAVCAILITPNKLRNDSLRSAGRLSQTFGLEFFFVAQHRGSGFVQSGFYEVALTTVQRARSPTRPHRTLKIQEFIRPDSIVAYFYSTTSPR
jgi:hypothetical protein